MIIVSQDKSIIVNFNNVEAIEIGNIEENQYKGTIYARLVSDYFYKIGEYKTEERAKEVLNAIGAYYALCEIYKSGEESDRAKINKYAAERGVEPFIFPMPEE